jgi:hypothetical protein
MDDAQNGIAADHPITGTVPGNGLSTRCTVSKPSFASLPRSRHA